MSNYIDYEIFLCILFYVVGVCLDLCMCVYIGMKMS